MKASRLEQDLGLILFGLITVMFPIYLIVQFISLFIPDGSTEV